MPRDPDRGLRSSQCRSSSRSRSSAWASAHPVSALGVDPWTAGVGVTAYAVYAAPTVASGQATFAGYVKLDDTATWIGILDYVLDRGTDVTGLAPSTYEAMLTLWLGDGYPIGSFVPLGVTKLLEADPAWTWQPYLSFLAALLALVLHELSAASSAHVSYAPSPR